MELRNLRQQFRTDLSGIYPDSEVDSIFYILIEDLLGLPRHILGVQPQKSITELEANQLKDSLAELKKGVPLQYIIGKTQFLDLDLEVGPGVLIPRPETAELVLWILEHHNSIGQTMRILDVGTGSGCIPIGLKSKMPNAELHGLDRSVEALNYARKNAEFHKLTIHWHEADMAIPLKIGGFFDLIVSNPPYIPEAEAQSMHTNVRDFEPSEALFVPNEIPLLYYQQLMERCNENLKVGGWLYLEIHEDFGAEVTELLHRNGFTEVLLKRDIFGKPRFVRGRMEQMIT
jgi:release factor glutamine methyltransferase